MADRSKRCGLVAAVLLAACSSGWAAPTPGCRRAVLEGELNSGKELSQAIGGGLRVYFQPIASGWILRVLPASGPPGEHDYAELATPPYRSVTPLSISTDFAFRAQDAVGWNPRRFRYATSAASYARLARDYAAVTAPNGTPNGTPREAEVDLARDLARDLAQTSEGTFTILDARLVPGTADQWKAAAAVAAHFLSTAHTLIAEPDGHTSPLGRLDWVRFRLQLDVPAGFAVNSAWRLEPAVCEQRQR
jgi:hypothetical protein